MACEVERGARLRLERVARGEATLELGAVGAETLNE
jgi:hypothetical protein